LFFLFKQLQGFLIVDVVVTPFGWSTLWSKTFWPYLYYLYYLSFLLSGFYLCFSFLRKTENFFEKKQAKIILTTGLITLVLGSITNVLLPELKIYILPPIASILLLIFAGGLVYAITKYGLLTITPTLAFEAIMTGLTDSLILINLGGKIDFVNEPTFELLGYQKEELIGKPIDFLTKGRPSFDELLKEEVIKNYETEYFSKSGERVPISLNSVLIRDKTGQLLGAVLVARGIKEIKEFITQLSEKIKALEIAGQEAEKSRLATLNILEDIEETRKELEREKERIEKIVLSFVDGLLVLQDSEIMLLNPSAENILGVKSKDILGKPLNLLSKYQNLKILSYFLKEKKGKPVFREEIIFKEPERVFQITLTSISKNQDLIVLHEITREKLIEQMKTEFVSLAAHQLRTPLSAVKWTLRMVLDGDLGKITKEQRDFLEKTYSSNERMINLINDLLNVARIEEGRYLYKLSPSKIEEIVQDIINSYLEEIKRKKIQFSFQKPKEKLPTVEVDKEKIILAIQNVIDNAIRYTPKGGRVTVSLKRANMKIELSVKDTGVGIPKDQQDRVFSKFFRAANVIRLETEGSGLGLFIAKNIIEAHGGKVWFESEENKGTTFYFTLPVKKT